MASEESGNFLQTFWSLSSVEEIERLQAARELLTSLKNFQADSGEEICSELSYCVQRLVRGLASNRKGARHGFYTALTELLCQFKEVPLSTIFQLIQSHLVVGGGVKSQEERGVYFGRVFALDALVQSGRLKETEAIVNVASQLHTCAQRKSYLREFSATTICQLLDACPSDDVTRDHVMPVLGLESGWNGCTPERLQTILHLNKKYGKRDWFKEYVQTHWKSKHILSPRNFEHMSNALLESSSSHPRLHNVWPLVIDGLRQKKTHFRTFWTTVVDTSLFTSSHERKYLGFKLLEYLFPSLGVEEVGVVFTPNLMRCLVNNATSETNYLHPAVRHLLSELTSHVESTSDHTHLVTLLLHLQRRTNGRFDQLTGSKITELITGKLDINGAGQLVDQLKEVFTSPTSFSDEDIPDNAHSVQQWALEQILCTVRNHKLPRGDSWLLAAAQFLLVHAFFKTADEKSTLIHDSCLLKFTSVLTDLSSLSLRIEGESGESGRTRYGPPGVMQKGKFFTTALFEFACKMLETGQDEVSPLHPFSKEDKEAWETVTGSMNMLSDKEDITNEEKAFLLLFSTAGLQLLYQQDRDSTCATIKELKDCFGEVVDSMSREAKKTPSKRKKLVSGPTWIEVFTDMLLGMLSQPSQLWRTIVEQAFRLVTGSVTEASFNLVLKVLEPKQSKEELMEDDDDDDDVGVTNGDHDGMESGQKINTGDVSSDSEDGETSDGDEEDNEGADPLFAAEVRKVLGAAAMDSDMESECSVDDDAMMAVDEGLAAVFRKRFAIKHQKKQQKDDERSVMHFKLRVLDLAEAYIRKESTNPLIFDILLTLYELVRVSQTSKSSTPLAKRAAGLLDKLCHAKEYPKSGFKLEDVQTQLHKLVEYLYKATPSSSHLLTLGILFLIRVLRGSSAPPTISPITTRAGRKRKQSARVAPEEVSNNGMLNVPLVTEWFGDALHNFITVKNSNVNPVFFVTYIQRYPALSALLVPRMFEDLPAAANHFKKTQVYEMLSVLQDSGVEGSSDIRDKLTNEHADALVSVTTNTKKRKRSKRKRSKKTVQ